MGMVKRSGAENGTVLTNDIPFICIVFPSTVLMANGHTEMIGVVIRFRCIHPDDICFACKPGGKMQR